MVRLTLSLKLVLGLTLLVCGTWASSHNYTFPDGFKCGRDNWNNKKRKYLVVGEHTKGGAGNFFVFYPAAYALAILTGRKLVTLTGTHPNNACFTQTACNISDSDELKKVDKQFEKGWTDSFRGIKAWDMYRWGATQDTFDEVILHPKGFQEKSEWWLHNSTLLDCMHREIPECKRADLACVIKKSFVELMPGPFQTKFRSKMSVTGDEERIDAMFSQPLVDVPRYDASLHLRVQFSHFENHTDPNDPVFVQYVHEYLQKTQTKSLFNNVVKRLEYMLMPDGHNSSHDESFSVYIASDSEIVKRALSDLLETNGYIVTLAHSEGVKHSNIGHAHDIGTFYAFYDWLSIANSDRMLAWRSVPPGQCLSLLSSFAMSAHRYKRPKAYVLSDPNRHDASDRNWHKFYG